MEEKKILIIDKIRKILHYETSKVKVLYSGGDILY